MELPDSEHTENRPPSHTILAGSAVMTPGSCCALSTKKPASRKVERTASTVLDSGAFTLTTSSLPDGIGFPREAQADTATTAAKILADCAVFMLRLRSVPEGSAKLGPPSNGIFESTVPVMG